MYQVFVYWKPLGFGHGSDGKPTEFWQVTCRAVHETIPGGARIIGKYISGWDFIHLWTALEYLGEACPNNQLLALARVVAANKNEHPPAPPVHIHTKDEKTIIISYTEDAALEEALKRGCRVVNGHTYKGRMWRELAVCQQKWQDTVIKLEYPPNPDMLSVYTRRRMTSQIFQRYDRSNIDGLRHDHNIELMKDLLAVEGVEEAFVKPYEIRLTKGNGFTWQELESQVLEAFAKHGFN